MRSRIMYIESKAEGLNGPARIGRVTFNKTGKTLFYRDQSFQSMKGRGFKANYRDTEAGDDDGEGAGFALGPGAGSIRESRWLA